MGFLFEGDAVSATPAGKYIWHVRRHQMSIGRITVPRITEEIFDTKFYEQPLSKRSLTCWGFLRHIHGRPWAVLRCRTAEPPWGWFFFIFLQTTIFSPGAPCPQYVAGQHQAEVARWRTLLPAGWLLRGLRAKIMSLGSSWGGEYISNKVTMDEWLDLSRSVVMWKHAAPACVRCDSEIWLSTRLASRSWRIWSNVVQYDIWSNVIQGVISLADRRSSSGSNPPHNHNNVTLQRAHTKIFDAVRFLLNRNQKYLSARKNL